MAAIYVPQPLDIIHVTPVQPSTGQPAPIQQAVTVGQLAGTLGPVPQQKYNVRADTSAAALVGGDITGAGDTVILNMTGTLGAGAAVTLPTVAALVAAMTAAGITPTPGTSYELDIYNSSGANFAWTITTNTGWTLTGTMTVAQNTFRRCIVTFTSLTAVVLQSLGQFAIGAGI